MRIFGVVSLLIALVVVGLLAKKKLTGTASSVAGASGAQPVSGASAKVQSQQVQAQQIQAQVESAVEAALQQRRPEPDDK